MKICKYDAIFVLVCFMVLGIFTYFAWQDVDIQFLGFTSGDELPQFKQLNNVLEGYLSFDLEKMFRIEFYNYGYIYYLLNTFIAAPFNILEKYDWAIFAPRFLNGVFSILNLWMIYKIANLYLDKSRGLLLVIFCLLIPGFWHYGYIFKPDVFQAFFVLCSVYFLCLDNFVYKKNFYLSTVMLGLGIGVAKFQAIMFSPLLCAYVFVPFLSNPRFKTFWLGCWKSCIVVLCLLFIWVITNPYLLHPSGMKAWWNMFVLNMQSNATNHGSYISVDFFDKVLMINYFYLSFFVVCLVLSLLIYYFFSKKDNKKMFFIIFSTFLVSLCYLLCFVNKVWGIYYFSTFLLFVLFLIPICLFKKWYWIYILLVCLQIANISITHSFVLFKKENKDLSFVKERGYEIVGVLNQFIKTKDIKIYTNVSDFSYSDIGLSFKNIFQFYGSFLPSYLDVEIFKKEYPYKDPQKYFYQWDIIIVSKEFLQNIESRISLDQNAKISKATIENIDKYGYKKVAETQNFLFFKYTK